MHAYAMLAQNGQLRLSDQLARLADYGGAPVAAMFLVAGFYAYALLTNKRGALLGITLIALTFSGFSVEAVDVGMRLLRWVTMFALGVLGVRPLLLPPWLRWWAAMGVFILLCSFNSTEAALQGVLLVWNLVFFGSALRGYLTSWKAVDRTFLYIMLAGVAWLGIGLLGGSLHEGARFAGASRKVPVFVMIGGFLMPGLAWNILAARQTWRRWTAMGLYAAVFLVCLITTQRAGFFAGVIGSSVVFFRFSLRSVVATLLTVAILTTGTYGILQLLPEQRDFLMQRYFESGTTGRGELWELGLQACYADPILPRGKNASFLIAPIGFHSGYITTWYEFGFFGLTLYLLALVANGVSALLTLSRVSLPRTNLTARFCLGVLLAFGAYSVVETGLSPSDVTTTMLILAAALHACLPTLAQEEFQSAHPPVGPVGAQSIPPTPVIATRSAPYA